MATHLTEKMFSIFIDPKSHQPLHPELVQDTCCSAGCGCGSRPRLYLMDETKKAMYPIADEIVLMLSEDDVTGKNKRYQELYDGCAWWYGPSQRLFQWWFHHVKGRKKGPEVLDLPKTLGITAGQRVLEVSVGTGLKLEQMPDGIEFYGIDISLGMLEQCRKTAVRTSFPVVLVHGKAEALPFADNSFDVVYHVGGINFFSDKAAAIAEMVRVAKPGAQILISDETEKVAQAMETVPVGRRFFSNRDEQIVPPVELIAKHVNRNAIQVAYTHDDGLYIITFAKSDTTTPTELTDR